MKVVYLHGIGDGDPGAEWLDGLNRGLVQAGHDPIHPDQVIAPRYSGTLKTTGVSAKLPPLTYKVPKDEDVHRREFERRQARVHRLLNLRGEATGFGWSAVSDSTVYNSVAGALVDHTSVQNLDQVRRYIRDENVRGAIMGHILDHLPARGSIMLIAHSLGSVIAIDLLDHLHPDLHIDRFITIGSPANLQVLHEGSARLLKKFPYSRVNDWSNFLHPGDVVTGGRGLASVFPGAQDFVLSGSSHDAAVYLGQPAVATLVADILYPSAEVAVTSTDVVVRMTDAEASLLLMQHFAEAVAHRIKDQDAATRYRAALKLLRDDIAAQLEQQYRMGRLSSEMSDLTQGELPRLPHRWELHEAVGELVVMALTNCVAPFDIQVGDAPILALEDVSVELGLTRQVGRSVATAIKDVEAAIGGKESVPWGRVLTAAAGIALLAAGPIGLAVAAPAGAFGAAAITGGLAAFGPGGMVGGLAMLGGLAGTGAATAAAAVAASGDSGATVPNLEKLMMSVAAEHARKLLDLPIDTSLWYRLSDFELQVSAMINRLQPLSDPKAMKVAELLKARSAIQALLRFMIQRGLCPAQIADTAPERELESPIAD